MKSQVKERKFIWDEGTKILKISDDYRFINLIHRKRYHDEYYNSWIDESWAVEITYSTGSYNYNISKEVWEEIKEMGLE